MNAVLLFVDTETTGMIDFTRALDHPAQPRIVQLAAYLADDDADATHVASLNAIIRPDGWTIPEEVVRIHHITTERARAFGEPIHDVLTRFYELVHRADPGRIIAHNHDFDNRMLLRETALDGFDVTLLGLLRPFCTMRALTERMNLPGRFGKPKWPKLDEAYRYCFGHDPDADARHSAMGDVLSCRDIFVHGRRERWWS